MKAKFFSTKFFFSVLVVFAVICLFVVFFGVVRANERSVSRAITVGTDDMAAMHMPVDDMNVVTRVHYVVDYDNIVSSVYNNVHEQVNVLDVEDHLDAQDHLAVVDPILVDKHVDRSLDVAENHVMAV
jgi:hypothetical protein